MDSSVLPNHTTTSTKITASKVGFNTESVEDYKSPQTANLRRRSKIIEKVHVFRDTVTGGSSKSSIERDFVETVCRL